MTWILFYGRMLGMAKQEILLTRYGEMLDMISCYAIYNGNAKEKHAKRKWKYEDAIALN